MRDFETTQYRCDALKKSIPTIRKLHITCGFMNVELREGVSTDSMREQRGEMINSQ
jgi:hypothetical protein